MLQLRDLTLVVFFKPYIPFLEFTIDQLEPGLVDFGEFGELSLEVLDSLS